MKMEVVDYELEEKDLFSVEDDDCELDKYLKFVVEYDHAAQTIKIYRADGYDDALTFTAPEAKALAETILDQIQSQPDI